MSFTRPRRAPLTWARIAALISRLTQSVFDVEILRLNTYVDDPLSAIQGTDEDARLQAALVILIWSGLRLPLSFGKASFAESVTWTSATFNVVYDPEPAVDVTIKQAIVDDVLDSTKAFLECNVVAIKPLTSYCGKLMHIASLIYTLRPFLGDLYAAIHNRDSGPTRAPLGCIWRQQIQHVLDWVLAFLTMTIGPLRRRYYLSAYRGYASNIELNLDASP